MTPIVALETTKHDWTHVHRGVRCALRVPGGGGPEESGSLNHECVFLLDSEQALAMP